MTCRPLPGGGFACSRTIGGRQICDEAGCGRAMRFLCDWRLTGKKAGQTCDRKVCVAHAREVADDKHLCPVHQTMWAAHPKNPQKTQE